MTKAAPEGTAPIPTEPTSSDLNGSGYAVAREHYETYGWDGILPIPAERKDPPPDGTTGAGRPMPTREQRIAWAEQRPGDNVALRLPENVLGLDVDGHSGKSGADTLAEWEALHGELPPTWRSTSRLDDPVSGIRYYRVPTGLAWPGRLPGIDLIHHGLRYAMVWPSIHPERGTYRWYEPSGQLADEPHAGDLPDPAQLPELPRAWVQALTGGEVAGPAQPRGALVDVGQFLTGGDPCPKIVKARAKYDRATEAGEARHDAMLPAVQAIIRWGERGHAGTEAALSDLHAAFVGAVACDRPGGDRQAEDEWTRAVNGAVRRITGEPSTGRRGCCGTTTATGGAPLNLPDEFWTARPVLTHIRQAAHSRVRSADAVLAAVLARLSAMVSHELRFDAGLGRGSLNLFTAVVGKSGTGKSTAVALAGELMDPPPWLRGDAFRDGLPLGSGEGLPEAFMGWVSEPTDEVYKSGPSKGEPKTKQVRKQVRHNALLLADEGQMLTAQAGRSGATIGPTLRSAAVGELLGQANAREETTRIIPAGSYSLGMVIGYQRGTAGDLLADTDAGTPQRFLWASATDPSIPDEPVEWPGQIGTAGLAADTGDQFAAAGGTPRRGTIEFAGAIRAELRRDALAVQRGQDGHTSELDSHAALMRCKLAALLALLDGRGHVTEDDWQLSGALWAASCAVRDSLVVYGQQQRERQAEARDDAAVSRAQRVAVAQSQASGTVERVARHLALKVHDKGEQTPGAAKQLLRSTDRHLFREAVEHAVTLGWVIEDDGKIAAGASRPVAS